jgi:purine-binding chemotaxis protein CheW
MGELVATKGQTTRDKEESQYLTFLLGGEMFAIEILTIKEIIEFGNLTTVPMMPDFVRGVINVRGAVLPVIDLSSRFSRKPSEVTRRSCIVIIETTAQGEDKQDVGVLVDSVSAVMEIPAAEIEPPPAFGARVRVDFISGMAKVNGRFVIVLNVDKVLSVDEMVLLSDISDHNG